MKITVSTAGLLDDLLPPGSEGDTAELEVAEGATLADVLAQLGISADENFLLSVNDEVVVRSERGSRVLADRDAVAILPALKGG